MLVGAACCLVGADVGVVTTTDGTTYEGEITQKDGSTIVVRHGVRTTIADEEVAGIDYAPYVERFRTRLAGLPEDDVDGRVTLAREAFDRGEYALAADAAESALEINPLHREARQLSSLIAQQRALSTSRPADATPAAGGGSRQREHGLDADQINRLRQLELKPGDRARISFRDNVRKRFIESIPGASYQSFAARTDVDQALLILRDGTPEMVSDVVIMNDPDGIATFQRRLHGAIISGCATSACHGGDRAGDFRLIGQTPDPATAITNFYLLNKYHRDAPLQPNQFFGGRGVDMIDRANGRQSLLYQYSLPRNLAETKHPLVRGWDGIARNDNDRFMRELVTWMEHGLTRIRAADDFDFSLGATAAAETSTTTPSTLPTTQEVAP